MSAEKRILLDYSALNKIDLKDSDLNRLNDGEWLNDNVIDAYLNLLKKESKQRDLIILDSNASQYLRRYGFKNDGTDSRVIFETEDLNANRVKFVKALLKHGANKMKFCLPVNIDRKHWILCIIDTNLQTVEFYDSLRVEYKYKKDDIKQTKSNVAHIHFKIKDLLKLAHVYLKVKELITKKHQNSDSSWKQHVRQSTEDIKRVLNVRVDAKNEFNFNHRTSMQQTNSYDCGIFVLLNITLVCLGKNAHVNGAQHFEAKEVQAFRQRIQNILKNDKHNVNADITLEEIVGDLLHKFSSNERALRRRRRGKKHILPRIMQLGSANQSTFNSIPGSRSTKYRNILKRIHQNQDMIIKTVDHDQFYEQESLMCADYSVLNVLFLQNIKVDRDKFLTLRRRHRNNRKYSDFLDLLQHCASEDFSVDVYQRRPGFLKHMRKLLDAGNCLWIHVKDHHLAAIGTCSTGIVCLNTYGKKHGYGGFSVFSTDELLHGCSTYVQIR